jgi:hypothetical protein
MPCRSQARKGRRLRPRPRRDPFQASSIPPRNLLRGRRLRPRQDPFQASPIPLRNLPRERRLRPRRDPFQASSIPTQNLSRGRHLRLGRPPIYLEPPVVRGRREQMHRASRKLAFRLWPPRRDSQTRFWRQRRPPNLQPRLLQSPRRRPRHEASPHTALHRRRHRVRLRRWQDWRRRHLRRRRG